MEQQLKRIQEKMQQLIKKNALLQKDLEKKNEEIRELKQQISEGLQYNEALQQKVSALSLASGALNEEEKKEMERKMNHYIKQIDRCITMLAE
ncbi:MAG: hypothetical protein K2P88_02020 [Chitinophagaceae bacterium]|jgi:uncharacterized protein YoxC|uniref:hypothetical protein n=1 Tax=unclassified Paraflavitalea TaxID=2798305 RepID=UPI003D32A866|nr:hypothetical protein [Chitinophagaceae bacterium]